eukprot:Skav234521  [mRNA]  locus=scaffold2407:40083:40497:- [translate_table: standard]
MTQGGDFMSSLAKTRHPFRRVVMAGDSSLLDTVPQSQTVATSQGEAVALGAWEVTVSQWPCGHDLGGHS